MPMPVTAPHGVLTADGQQQILPRLTDVLAGLSGGEAVKPMIGGTVHVLDAAQVYAGGVPSPVVMVELKLPGVGLPDLASRAAFIEQATAVVDELTEDGHDRGSTWVNVVNAPDGGWGVGGVSLTDERLQTGR